LKRNRTDETWQHLDKARSRDAFKRLEYGEDQTPSFGCFPLGWNPARMIAAYVNRRFQLWEYLVSHGSLLIRSPKGPSADRNVDLIFVGVDYLAVPHMLNGVTLDHGTIADVKMVAATFGEVQPDRLFVLSSAGHRHPIVAANCRIEENDGDIFDSPFDFRHCNSNSSTRNPEPPRTS
jgi:hypothetical protein